MAAAAAVVIIESNRFISVSCDPPAAGEFLTLGEPGRRANSADESDKTVRTPRARSCWQEKGEVQLRQLEVPQGAGFGLKAAVLESKPMFGAVSAPNMSLSPLLMTLSSGTQLSEIPSSAR